jgi:hypothetical protein
VSDEDLFRETMLGMGDVKPLQVKPPQIKSVSREAPAPTEAQLRARSAR